MTNTSLRVLYFDKLLNTKLVLNKTNSTFFAVWYIFLFVFFSFILTDKHPKWLNVDFQFANVVTRGRCTLKKMYWSSPERDELESTSVFQSRKLCLSTCRLPRTTSLIQPTSAGAHRMLSWDTSRTSQQQQVRPATRSCLDALLTWIHWIGSQPHFLSGDVTFIFRYLRIWTIWLAFSKYWGRRRRWVFYSFTFKLFLRFKGCYKHFNIIVPM